MKDRLLLHMLWLMLTMVLMGQEELGLPLVLYHVELLAVLELEEAEVLAGQSLAPLLAKVRFII
jgi:hypothetical protein